MASIYYGRKNDHPLRSPVWEVKKVDDSGTSDFDPAKSRKVFNHSTAFSWGYGGSGPAQLALALLLDQGINEGMAVLMHQQFKASVIATWSQNESWSITSEKIQTWIANNWNEARERCHHTSGISTIHLDHDDFYCPTCEYWECFGEG